MIHLALLALAFMLPVTVTAATVAANPSNDQLMKLDPLRQRSVIRRAILDSGNACGRVTGAAWRGPYKNLQRWDADCDRGGSYGVFIGPDGSVQVSDCPSMAELKLTLCRPIATPPQPGRKK